MSVRSVRSVRCSSPFRLYAGEFRPCKRKLIQSKRSYAISMPGVGLGSGTRIDPNPVLSGLPSGTRLGAEAGGDAFGGDEIASASRVPDDVRGDCVLVNGHRRMLRFFWL